MSQGTTATGATSTSGPAPPPAADSPPAGTAAYCPHCLLLLEQDVTPPWPPRPARCPHCRLVVGAGRARSRPGARPGARGSAAGVYAQRARRDGYEPEATPAAVREAIRSVAHEVGTRPERLLMVDYQQRAVANRSLPDLTEVFAVFGGWKRARREAGRC